MFNFFWIPIPSRHSLMGKILHYVMQSLDINPEAAHFLIPHKHQHPSKKNRKHWWLWLEGFPLVGTHNLGSPLCFGEYCCSTHLGIPLGRFWLQHFQQMRCSDKHHVLFGISPGPSLHPIHVVVNSQSSASPPLGFFPKGIPVLSKKITR